MDTQIALGGLAVLNRRPAFVVEVHRTGAGDEGTRGIADPAAARCAGILRLIVFQTSSVGNCRYDRPGALAPPRDSGAGSPGSCCACSTWRSIHCRSVRHRTAGFGRGEMLEPFSGHSEYLPVDTAAAQRRIRTSQWPSRISPSPRRICRPPGTGPADLQRLRACNSTRWVVEQLRQAFGADDFQEIR